MNQTYKFYEAMLRFLKTDINRCSSQVDPLEKLWHDKLTWPSAPLMGKHLADLHRAVDGNINLMRVAEEFIARAFVDLSGLRNPSAQKLFRSLRELCGVHEPAFAMCGKLKFCKRSGVWIAILPISDPVAFKKFIADAPGTGSFEEGKIVY